MNETSNNKEAPHQSTEHIAGGKGSSLCGERLIPGFEKCHYCMYSYRIVDDLALDSTFDECCGHLVSICFVCKSVAIEETLNSRELHNTMLTYENCPYKTTFGKYYDRN